MIRYELRGGDDELRIAKGGAKRVDDKPTSTGLTQPGLLGWLLRLSDLASTGFWSGARCRCHGQIDLIAPRVPPREPREQVLPARREILHFLKTARQGKICISPEIGTCVDAADRLAASSRKAVRQTPRARPHCCFLIGGARPPRLASETLAA